MSVLAVMKNGESFRLDEGLGRNPREIIEGLFGDSLTGSAAPDAWLSTATGALIRYSNIDRLEQEPDN